MDMWTIGLLVLIAGLLLIVQGQASEIKVLRKQQQTYMPKASLAELKAAAENKLKTAGPIETVKFLRVEKGMSMVDAKRLVDTLKH